MKILYKIVAVLILGAITWSCSPSLQKKDSKKEEPVVIANDSLEYEIIIVDIGFNRFLNTIAKPRGFYELSYLENKNRIYTSAWNRIANNPLATGLQFNRIDYEPTIRYGMEVNYLLFNYFEFAQRKYRVDLISGLRRNNKRPFTP